MDAYLTLLRVQLIIFKKKNHIIYINLLIWELNTLKVYLMLLQSILNKRPRNVSFVLTEVFRK